MRQRTVVAATEWAALTTAAAEAAEEESFWHPPHYPPAAEATAEVWEHPLQGRGRGVDVAGFVGAADGGGAGAGAGAGGRVAGVPAQSAAGVTLTASPGPHAPGQAGGSRCGRRGGR